MPRPKSKTMLRCEELAQQFGISAKSVQLCGAWRPMAEQARILLINGVRARCGMAPAEIADSEKCEDPVIAAIERDHPAKRVNLNHSDAVFAPLTITETDDTISITIPKRPISKMSAEEAAAVLAVRRAGRVS